MRERRWLLPTLYGLLLALAVSDALKAARPKFKIATSSTTSTTTEEPDAAESADDEVEATTTAAETNGTTGHTLTGIPQIDYIWDPNLPRELNGYNLSEYPFYASMPEDIDFKCDGLHDGFYASVPHKCQVYHHCLYGTRYDFLCANFTAFDQKTFICHFVSEVDCTNSKKYWHRNDALYQAATTTTSSTTTTTTTTTTTPSSVDKSERLAGSARDRDRDRDGMPRRRRPPPRRPAYDYYDEDYYEDDYQRTRPRGYNRRDYDDYDDRKYSKRDRERDRDYRHRDFRDRERDRFSMRGNRRDPARARDPMDDEPPRMRVKDQDSSRTRDLEERVRNGDERRYSDKRFRDEYDDKEPESTSNGSGEGLVKPAAPSTSLYARPRPPPKLRRPVPISEQDKYSFSTSTTTRTPIDEPRRRPAAIDDAEEPHRRPAIVSDDLEEPRRRPVAVELDSIEEPRRRPAVALADSLEETVQSRRRPAVALADSLEETVQSRRRPVEILDDEDYYEDEMEEVRPRWQMRARPSLRERDFPDKRYRDRPYRTRYRDDDEEVRPRKSQLQHSERSKDRFYDRERSRDRSLLDRPKDRDRDRPSSVYNRDRESERPRAQSSSLRLNKESAQEVVEPTKRTTTERQLPMTTTASTTTTPTTTSTTTEEPESDTLTPQTEEKQQQKFNFHKMETPNKYQHRSQQQEATTEKEQSAKYWKPTQRPSEREREETIEDYPSEYYDDVEEPAIVPVPPPPPRSTVRVVKRPFLPSRGGNPNPRGLSPVGSKATTSPRRDENPMKHYIKVQTTTASPYSSDDDDKVPSSPDNYQNQNYNYDANKHNYNSYATNNNYNPQQTEQYVPKQQPINENYDVPATRTDSRRPESDFPKRLSRPESQEVPIAQKAVTSWTTDYVIPHQNNNQEQQQQHRGNVRHQQQQQQQNDNGNQYGSSYKNDDPQDQLSINANFKIKQKINEVTHRNLQDIPESEYDVTLNEALTPNLSQEPSLPSGFVLPLHRQLGRDAILQPSENNYKFSRPQQQLEQPKQQPAFVASPQFAPQSSPIARSSDRGKTVYFRTPETIQIGSSHYRQQRGHWNDYSGF